jgi:ubiquinone/menaquinone biosynthesis C-methylase UbiE
MGNLKMAELSPLRRMMKVFHPESIPWPGTVFYNALSSTNIFQRNYELVAEDIVNYRSEGSVLDMGTGPGWLLIKLHEKSPNLRITGLDNSPSMVAKAEKNIAEAGLSRYIEVKEGNVIDLPFADSTFDAVVSTGSIHHWKDPDAGLNDIYRVLKPGGLAMLYDIVSDTPKSVLKATAREFGRLRMVMLWIHAFEEPFYSREELRSLAQSSKFKEGKARFVGVLCCLMLRKGPESG